MEEHERSREAFASQEEYRLHALRHSTAHVMAEAIGQVFPGTSFAIGPAIKDGFYYDVDVSRPISEEDLAAIEVRMKRIVKRNSRFERHEWSKDQARAFFAEAGQGFKLELIDGIEDETVTIYDQNGFIDLCAGPHVPRTRNCKHFKLLKVSGAYWRGDASGPQLQRVYGTVWPTRKALDAHLHRLEEAKKRDHRKLGRELGLFMFHEAAPGVPIFLPKGELIYQLLQDAMRTRLLRREGYDALRTPLLYDKSLWETSGHWQHYREDMFVVREGEQALKEPNQDEEEGRPERLLALKPMNCPPAMLVFRSQKRSYRELPLRFSDMGVLHRNELRGALGGLTRVRQFCQDDANHFIAEDMIESEITHLLELIGTIYGAFGLGYKTKLSTRPEDKLGDDALWDQAEAGLKAALANAGMDYQIDEGDGAFYGPKIDFEIVDALERQWQCATIQLDYQLPQRFELKYVGADNEEHVPVVIHRTVIGSIERFMGILIEHFAGAFPVWLAPEQVRVMTVSDKSVPYARSVTQALHDAGVRVHCDDRDAKIGYKIRECHFQRVPYMAIIGAKEVEAGTVSVRGRDSGDEGALELQAFVDRLIGESQVPF